MSRREIELIKAETRRLEALGIVLRNLGYAVRQAGAVRPSATKRGRKRKHRDQAAKMRAYRERKSWRPLAAINANEKVADLRKVAKKRAASS